MSLILKSILTIIFLLIFVDPGYASSIIIRSKDSKPIKIADGFKFLEGPVWHDNGVLFFSDYRDKKIYKWSKSKGISVYKKQIGSTNGLRIDKNGHLVVCQPDARRVIEISEDGEITVIADSYNNMKLNSPNDIWVDPHNGIYFTDPRFGSKINDLEQTGFNVYYVDPNRNKITKVIDNLKKPNGIVGTSDGKKLFVTDRGDKKTYIYDINYVGTLSDRKTFINNSSDGLTLDKNRNLYTTGESGSKNVEIYSKKGILIHSIPLPEEPTNITFGGQNGDVLFITTVNSLYSIKLNMSGDANPFSNN